MPFTRFWRLSLVLGLLLGYVQPVPLPAAKVGVRPGTVGTVESPLPLSYFVLTASLEQPLRSGARLTPIRFERLRRIAQQEAAALAALRSRSEMIIADAALSLEQKRLAIARMGYNHQVEAILYRSDQQARQALGREGYARLVAWIKERWPWEVARHGMAAFMEPPPLSWGQRLFPLLLPRQAARTYEIYATRYDSKGRYTVALPDQCLKFTNGGLRTCVDQGYVVGQTYSVVIRYKKTVGVNVGESGPWNIDDNFWATLKDPTPRRMFADLPLGMPEAQAAFYNGYNGGLDQFGRKVTAPFAIDLSFEVANDLGLPNKVNDWVTVSFLWTEGWGAGGSKGGTSGGTGASLTQAAQIVAAIATSTPAADGSVRHTVQAGQTLWGIALAYGVTVAQLRQWNGLGERDVILPGQTLLVIPPKSLSSGTLVPSVTSSVPPSETPSAIPSLPPTSGRNEANASPYPETSAVFTEARTTTDRGAATTALPWEREGKPLGRGWLFIFSALIVGGMVLLSWGLWLQRHSWRKF